MKKFQIQLLIILMLALGGGTVQAASTEIRAHIAAVRIIVVNDDDRITQIYQNSDQGVNPDVRRNTADGPKIAYTPLIAQQYAVYHQELPSLIQTLYAML